jgi:hypothetical protein
MGWLPDLARDGRTAHAVAPGGPGLLPWPVDRQMQHQPAGGGGDAGRDGDEGCGGIVKQTAPVKAAIAAINADAWTPIA